jgi:hypothetical protein
VHIQCAMWGRVTESSPPTQPYVDVISRGDYDMCCEVFINDVCMVGMLGFNFNPKHTVELLFFRRKEDRQIAHGCRCPCPES